MAAGCGRSKTLMPLKVPTDTFGNSAINQPAARAAKYGGVTPLAGSLPTLHSTSATATVPFCSRLESPTHAIISQPTNCPNQPSAIHPSFLYLNSSTLLANRHRRVG
jgi:hypothetical protein